MPDPRMQTRPVTHIAHMDSWCVAVRKLAGWVSQTTENTNGANRMQADPANQMAGAKTTGMERTLATYRRGRCVSEKAGKQTEDVAGKTGG